LCEAVRELRRAVAAVEEERRSVPFLKKGMREGRCVEFTLDVVMAERGNEERVGYLWVIKWENKVLLEEPSAWIGGSESGVYVRKGISELFVASDSTDEGTEGGRDVWACSLVEMASGSPTVEGKRKTRRKKRRFVKKRWFMKKKQRFVPQLLGLRCADRSLSE